VVFRTPPDANRALREPQGAGVDTSLGPARGTTSIAWSRNGPTTDGSATGLGADVGERGSDGGISTCLWGSLYHLFGGIKAVKEG